MGFRVSGKGWKGERQAVAMKLGCTWLVVGSQPYEYGALGSALENVGDLNDDGFPDLAMGAPLANIGAVSNAGIAYVLFGGGEP